MVPGLAWFGSAKGWHGASKAVVWWLDVQVLTELSCMSSMFFVRTIKSMFVQIRGLSLASTV